LTLPAKTEENEYINSFISVDLAISKAATADKTAIVMIHLYGFKPEDRRYYVDIRFVNAKMTHLETLESITVLYNNLNSDSKKKPMVLVEQVQYQAAVPEQLNDRGVPCKGIKVYTDKRSRLQLASALFQMGKVYFPNDRKAGEIIQQLVGFGVEKYDDLADAMSMGLNYIQTNVKWVMTFAIGNTRDGRTAKFYGIKYMDD
jgi:predicted phage terminase large subunit-like protein